MTQQHPAFQTLHRPLTLTRWGMVAERLVRCFWPLWTVCLVILGALMLGLQDAVPVEVVWAAGAIGLAAALWFLWRGLRQFRRPTMEQALARLDATLPGRPIQTLNDTQAIGANDLGSQAVWDAHIERMAQRVRAARAVRPDLKIAARDPFALRYAALLLFSVALLFGSILRVASVTDMGPGVGQALAAGPAWEGWVEPPSYTGRPSLYLADISGETLRVPQGSKVTVQLYGRVGALKVEETVSGVLPNPVTEKDAQQVADVGQMAQSFVVAQSGTLKIDGQGGRTWDVAMEPDGAPAVSISTAAERKADGEFRLPFDAFDDYGVVRGTAVISLDLDAVDRRWGLTAAPDPREAITVDLPMPFNGDRADFEGVLTDNFSQHPWANLPVTIRLEVHDALGQSGQSADISENLGGLRFFDPLAKAIIEQRRDLLWAKDNARRVAQVLRAVSWSPNDIFRSEEDYATLHGIIEALEEGIETAPLSDDLQDDVSKDLWELAEKLEYGDLADALARLRRARDRLSEAIKNGASDEEIASLMQELREASKDYMRQLAENAERNGEEQPQGEMQEITGDQLQEMMDRIQELMEQGRMAEAQRLLDQLQQMMENMQVTQGQQGGEGQPSEGEQAMEDLADTLREQQELSDQAFRDLQELYNPNPGLGQSSGSESGEGEPSQGEAGEEGPQGQGGGEGEGQSEGSLADRQQALRNELNRQQGNLPGAGTPEGDAAREALGRAGDAMDGAEEALRDGDFAEALDRQSDAMDALREGMRDLGDAMSQNQNQQNGEGRTGSGGDGQGDQRDPLGRESGSQGRSGTDQDLLQGEDVYRRAEELLDEIRRRAGEQERSQQELDYLKRLLDRF